MKLFADTTLTPVDLSPLPHHSGGTASDLQTILGIVFTVAGALALLFIVIGGLRYVLSAGDSQKISNAKNTILYAVIGLVIAIAGEAIVSFVLGNI